MPRRYLERGYRALRRVVPHDRWAAARNRVHPALRRSIRRLGTSVPNLGRISVVVPCYRVEEYLGDCLQSLVGQTYPHLEIIVVIDGSPDRSAEIARGFRRWDRRITVVEQPNGGLGNARNTGIARATGDFIAFVDSDDSLPRDAYSRMVRTLHATGSDFVVGNLRRREGSRAWVPKWAQDVHREDRLGITLDDAPEILADVFSWNKLFRRPFFDAVVGGFPEGIRYEDQEPTAKAYAEASAFDVLSSVVYDWHIRGDGSSITQQKSSVHDLQDRLTVMRAVSAVLTKYASTHVVEYWHAKSIGLDLRAYYYEVPRTGADFWRMLRDGVRDVARNMDEVSWPQVELHDRLIARLVERDQRDDVCTVLRLRQEYGDGVAVDPTKPRPVATPVYLDQLRTRFTESDLVLSPGEDRLRAGLLGFRSRGDDIEVTGMAYVEGVDLDVHASTLTVSLVAESSSAGRREESARRPVVVAAVRRTRMPAIDEVVNSALVSQAPAGFVATFSVVELLSHDGAGDEPPRWHVEVALEVAGRRYVSRFTQWDRRWSANRLEVGPLVSGRRLVPRYTSDRGLELLVRPAPVVVTLARLQGRRLELTFADGNGLLEQVREVRATCQALGRSVGVRPASGTGAPTVLTLPPLPPGAPPRKEYVWHLRALTDSGVARVDFAGGTSDLDEGSSYAGGLRISVASAGDLQLLDRRAHAVVRDVLMDEWPAAFTVTGWAVLPPGQDFHVGLASDTDLWEPSEAEHDRVTGHFRARFAVAARRWGKDGLGPSTRGRSLRLLRYPGSTTDSLWVPGAGAAGAFGFLEWHRGTVCDVRFTLTPRAGALWVNVRPPLRSDEAGRRAQLQLARSVPALLKQPLQESVLFSCFGGRHAADSPLAVHNELERRGYDGNLVWAVTDHSFAVPTGAKPVVIGTSAFYEALHTSRWLVNNNNFPHYFRKHADQKYLQTWHGTPLKRIGRDVPSASLSLSYRSLMEREVKFWDVLLAQNPFSAQTLPKAFGYEGRVLDVGYPRNDLLAGHADPGSVERVRSALGVNPGSRLVLYAPTWRDNRRTENRQYALVNHLELGQLSKALGKTWTVLVRGHSNTPGLSTSQTYPNVIDVSDYPDITELMLVADVLVTDYSSVMFDFVVTGKPMLFLVPDLDEYADRTRGFYLDFEDIAPGPLLGTTEEVIVELGRLALPPATDAQHGPSYRAFRERFAPRDDGQAAQRVVSALWDPEH